MATTSENSVLCPMCHFENPSMQSCLSHLWLVHGNDPCFCAQCRIGGCSYCARSFSALYSQVYRRHPESGVIRRSHCVIPEVEPETSEVAESSQIHHPTGTELQEVRADLDLLLGMDKAAQQQHAALFLLKLKECRQLSQAAIDDIVQEWEGLFSHTVQQLNARVCERLANAGVDVDNVEGLQEVFHDLPSPFEGLKTQHLQEKYYRDSLGLVEPVEIKVGNPYYDLTFTGAKRQLVQKQDTYQYVPVLSSLRSLLSDPSVMDQVEQSQHRVHTNGIMEDVCDGKLFKKHPLFSSDPSALQLIMFYDELEVCNPLGTHVKKHKLAKVLFILGNIHPKHQSSLRMINLLVAATLPVVEKHGIDMILPLVNDLRILATEGVTLMNHGVEQIFKGGVLLSLGDNLGSNTLGEFKQSFSFSYRFCRSCYVTNDTYKCISNPSELELRTDSKHCQECDLLDGPLHEHYSKTYGINRRSALLDILHINMFSGGLAHDIMHDVLEGVAPAEMSLILQHCIISEKYFSLYDYNFRVVHFDYDYTEMNKSPPIASRSIIADGKQLKLSASQTLLLIRILPLLIGDVVPFEDPNWQCFMLLSKIVNIIMCPWTSADVGAILQQLITEHHEAFIYLYSESADIPKLHFMLHYPEQILHGGPMVRTWTMRNEAKLSLFKQASRLGNFKNIPSSIANRHQRLQCYELSTSKLVSSAVECGPCSQPLSIDCEPIHIKESLFSLLPSIHSETKVVQPTWVKTDSRTIKKLAYVITGSGGLHPTFGKIMDLLVLLDVVVIEVSHCVVQYFDSYYHAYVILLSDHKSLIRFDELPDRSILHPHRKENVLYIYLKHYFHVIYKHYLCVLCHFVSSSQRFFTAAMLHEQFVNIACASGFMSDSSTFVPCSHAVSLIMLEPAWSHVQDILKQLILPLDMCQGYCIWVKCS